MRPQRMLAEVSCIPVVLALLLLISYCAAYANALDQCIHDTEVMQTLIYGPLDEATKKRQTFTTEGIKARTATQQYGAKPLMSNIRIVTSILDLETTGKYCTVAGGKVPDFMGGAEITCTADDIFTTEKKTILMEKVLPEALIMLSSALKVSQVQGNLKAPGCQYYTVPESHSTTGVPDADYVLYVSAAPTTGTAKSTVAWAGHCSIDQHRRPVNGRANFNPKDLVWDDKNPSAQRQLVRTAVHQILHALGFSSSLWDNPSNGPSPIKEETRRGKPVKYLSSNSVVAKAKAYFGCQTMKGPEMEDEGGVVTDESHWKRRTHMDDMMAGITGVWMYLSPITLAVMEDSGHYTVDWSKAEDPKWMYNAGCGVIDAKCDTNAGGKGKYFCFEPTYTSCAADHRSFGVCSSMRDTGVPEWAKYNGIQGRITGKEPFMDYCPIIQGRSETQCDNPHLTPGASDLPRYHGRDGRCFNSRAAKKTTPIHSGRTSSIFTPSASCLQTKCVNKVVQFKLPDIEKWITCPSVGARLVLKNVKELLNRYEGDIYCPDPNIVCDGIETPIPTPAVPTVRIVKNSDGNIRTATTGTDIIAPPRTPSDGRDTESVIPKQSTTDGNDKESKNRPPSAVEEGPGGSEKKPGASEKDREPEKTPLGKQHKNTEVKVPNAGPNIPIEKESKDNKPKIEGALEKKPVNPKDTKGGNPNTDVKLPEKGPNTPVPPVEPRPIKPKPGNTKVMITVPPMPDGNKSTPLSATAISSTIPAVLITSVVFLYLYK